ncbi:hypothetical protein TNCV_2033921 [Trichonephila clavipes]|nr:hypothetical protein TNCV_2033921 [Trichonephila clavipes]
MFGTCSDDALLRDQGRLLLSETWRLHFLRSGTVFPKVWSITSSHPWQTGEFVFVPERILEVSSLFVDSDCSRGAYLFPAISNHRVVDEKEREVFRVVC